MSSRRSLLHRPLTTTALLGALLLAGTGCSAFEEDDTVRVAAGFYPLAWVAEQVGGDDVEVANLTRPGKDAHSSEPSLQATATLARADLVVVSGGFQAEIDASVKANAKGRVLDVAKVLEFIPFEEHDHSHDHSHEDEHAGETEAEHADHADSHDGHDHGDSHDGHDHGDTDPHFWLNPLMMVTYAEALADELSDLDADNAETYRANADALVDQLTALDTEYAEGLASCERSTVVVSHDAFGYLKRYGLEFEAVAGLSPGAEPTPGDLKHLSEVIADEGVTTVFTETLAPTKLTEQLAKDAGIGTAVLDPLEGLVSSDSTDDYLSLMRANLGALQKANAC
ncbi:metal ABC transporter substrate-binding protein [Nocardioides yefusunii]|uniref:Metal ABC transporter substrate-binding protein n=1 Tax=Nocardioides yefusunii TaxID=2500546 RepID=A0ABW1QXV6_9ACTN|nr:metal ABC transporter substrate-binding protein [Nocardioides yefusunii]